MLMIRLFACICFKISHDYEFVNMPACQKVILQFNALSIQTFFGNFPTIYLISTNFFYFILVYFNKRLNVLQNKRLTEFYTCSLYFSNLERNKFF